MIPRATSIVFIFIAATLLTGCASTPRAELLPPSAKTDVEAASPIVIFGVIRSMRTTSNFTFAENYFSMLAPTPKNGWTVHMTIEIDGVAKGQFPYPTLQLDVHRPRGGFERKDLPLLQYGRRVCVGIEPSEKSPTRAAKIVLTEDVDYLRAIPD
jgi:hypothetical protein